MLVLKREKNQTIVVDGPCEITIGEIGAHNVKVLIAAPATTKILRGELVPHESAASTSSDVSNTPAE